MTSDRPFPMLYPIALMALAALLLMPRVAAQGHYPYTYGDQPGYGYYEYPRTYHHYYYWPQQDLLPRHYSGPDPGIYWNENSYQGRYGYSRPSVRDRRSYKSGYRGPVRTYPGGPVWNGPEQPQPNKGHMLRGQPGGGRLRTD